MKRVNFPARQNFNRTNEAVGFDYGNIDEVQYWQETAGYELSMNEVVKIQKASEELHQMCYEAVDHVIQNKLLDKFMIPKKFHALIEKSWKREDWGFYGRFDFVINGDSLKMYEYNADTPTSLLEASLVQYQWMFDNLKSDQYNSLHEDMISYWKNYKQAFHPTTLYFSCVDASQEDFRNTEYMMDCASQAGIDCKFILVKDIGSDGTNFYDLDDNKIEHMFKLYPWEWLVNEEFGDVVLKDTCRFIEPIWKMILSNKALMAILWELFPNHEYLLPTYFSPEKLGQDYVKKPLLSREGQNVEIFKNGKSLGNGSGLYTSEFNIYQALCPLPNIDGFHPVIGAWVIGEKGSGMGIREDKGLITGNTSFFVPHYIEGVFRGR